ncbi:carbohydrate ABC transporter permease [Paenibacillus cymbidii]|uniref:carbohydrate ABC transporter permease n=1 Tax=Paenibacillus cymbidii TaxID=1639034 RepID=UPI0010800F36|nr:carbohydrate ABC transporter permease [Paenibacillus cymbidii]
MRNAKKWGTLLRIVFSYGLAASMIFPFLWMVSTSFKTDAQVFRYPIEWIPHPLVWDGYIYVWKRSLIGVSFALFYWNSVKVAAIVLFGTFLSCSMAAYAYAKIKFAGRNALFLIKLATMMIPFQVVMLPTFILYKQFGLLNTHMALWLPAFFGGTFGTFLLRQFFLSVPDELAEAARMDGAGHATIYWRVLLPLTKPALVTLLVLTFVGTWNNYEAPLLYIRTATLYTIPIGLKVMSDDIEHMNYPGIMAGVVSSVIPILFLFVFTQKYFVQGMNYSGIKG